MILSFSSSKTRTSLKLIVLVHTGLYGWNVILYVLSIHWALFKAEMYFRPSQVVYSSRYSQVVPHLLNFVNQTKNDVSSLERVFQHNSTVSGWIVIGCTVLSRSPFRSNLVVKDKRHWTETRLNSTQKVTDAYPRGHIQFFSFCGI